MSNLNQVIAEYCAEVLVPQRSPSIARKIERQLYRFEAYCRGHLQLERLEHMVHRHVLAFQRYLEETEKLSSATVNNIMAAISVFCSYCHKNNPLLFAQGDPSKNITPLTLPPLEPRALTESQVRSLKSLCDRLPRLHQRQGRRVLARERREKIAAPTHAWARPYRDRAIVFLFLSTGLRREELVNLSWKHLDIGDRCTPEHLRQSRGMRLQGVRGKGKSMRTVFLSVDARQSLADYLEYEWYGDAGVGEDRALVLHEQPLFLSARGIPKRKIDGRLSLRAINFILNQIGRWHDADFGNKEQHISPLRPHDLRHTFAFMLAKVTQNDPYELQRRLGHRSQRYIERYTNPPEEVAAHYVEDF